MILSCNIGWSKDESIPPAVLFAVMGMPVRSVPIPDLGYGAEFCPDVEADGLKIVHLENQVNIVKTVLPDVEFGQVTRVTINGWRYGS
jgi:hypothetical protein